jgi:3-methyladenine DNA glycosylase/8-oxoguanine DNA glycosylase
VRAIGALEDEMPTSKVEKRCKAQLIRAYSQVEILRRVALPVAALILPNPTNERYCNNVERRHRYICEAALKLASGLRLERTLGQKSSEIDHPRYLIL